MALKLGAGLRSALAGQVETTVGTTPKLRIYTGSAPTNPGDAATGTLLVDIDLPSDWVTESGGVLTKAGTWSGTAANAGTAGYFRIWNSGASTAHIQGDCGEGSGELQLDNTDIAAGQTVTVSTFTLTMPAS